MGPAKEASSIHARPPARSGRGASTLLADINGCQQAIIRLWTRGGASIRLNCNANDKYVFAHLFFSPLYSISMVPATLEQLLADFTRIPWDAPTSWLAMGADNGKASRGGHGAASGPREGAELIFP